MSRVAGKTTASKTRKRKPATNAAAVAEQKAHESKAENSRRQATSVVVVALGVLLLLLLAIPGENIWHTAREIFFGVFGICAWVFSGLLIALAFMIAFDKQKKHMITRIWQTIALTVMIAALIFTLTRPDGTVGSLITQLGAEWTSASQTGMGSGIAGALIGLPLTAAFGRKAAIAVEILALFVFFMLLSGRGLVNLVQWLKAMKDRPKEMIEQYKKDHPDTDDEDDDEVFNIPKEATAVTVLDKKKTKSKFNTNIPYEAADSAEGPTPNQLADLQHAISNLNSPYKKPLRHGEDDLLSSSPEPISAEQEIDKLIEKSEPKKTNVFDTVVDAGDVKHGYTIPPMSLLHEPEIRSTGMMTEELKVTAASLVETLRSFGVETKIVNISCGPAVTRYELQPSAGVKISKITNLANDIALNLAAQSVRIEAPIPGKAAVGIEIPNKLVGTVNIREVLDTDEFRSAKSQLTVALGKDIAGNVTLADLSKMPHLLIAGSTGSGKSVCINTFIMSLIYKSTAEEVRFIMIDPKVVELGMYNGIPHLLVPVVTDPRKAAGALAWAVGEMLNRYKLFAAYNTRDLHGYNLIAKDNPELQVLPRIVIIIDELADLMMAAPNEVEDSICRLAQMARAAGMHLVIATQRPSVDVITGIIKANIPSRIAFAVSSHVDSRTILDGGGAEKLLGRGDMLFSPISAQKPLRVQGCYVSDGEVEDVINFLKKNSETAYDDTIAEEIERQAPKGGEKSDSGASGDGEEEVDEKLKDAIECVIEMGSASTSMLQRRLGLGYGRAARIIDELEARGIVGPMEGSKPRQVLLTRQQWYEMNMRQ